MKLAKFSLGVGDRFGREGEAQLRACMMAAEAGTRIVPVWNKSNREHLIIGSEPADTRAEADAAVKTLGWKDAYHVDADHIGLNTVDRHMAHSDFFTIDVADWIGKPAEAEEVGSFAERHPELAGRISIPGLNHPFQATRSDVERIAGEYLLAVREVGRVYRRISQAKAEESFIAEVSMDETARPQNPVELLVILAALADEKVALQTIAPKFPGRFNKGVDYQGDLAEFDRQFGEDLAVIDFAIKRYGLPETLKLSIHSGSDKFSIYPAIRRGLKRFQAGVHLKTAGTTWLEEVIGLAEAGGEGLALAKEIYAQALKQLDALCAPYSAVIEIDRTKLPSSDTVNGWDSRQLVSAARNDVSNPAYNPHLRQLLHVGYKVAAQMGNRYLAALEAHRDIVGRGVTKNLFERHIKPLFLEFTR